MNIKLKRCKPCGCTHAHTHTHTGVSMEIVRKEEACLWLLPWLERRRKQRATRSKHVSSWFKLNKLKVIKYNNEYYAKDPIQEVKATIDTNYFEALVNRIIRCGNIVHVALKLKALQDVATANPAIELPFVSCLTSDEVFFYGEGGMWPRTAVQQNWGYIGADKKLRVICTKGNYVHIYFTFIAK